MMHEQINPSLDVLHSASMNFLPHHDLRVGSVKPVIKLEIRILPRLVNRPASKAARYFRDVFLRVAAIHTERVQFHQLASVIFIQTALIFLRFLRIILRPRPPKSSPPPFPPPAPLRP